MTYTNLYQIDLPNKVTYSMEPSTGDKIVAKFRICRKDGKIPIIFKSEFKTKRQQIEIPTPEQDAKAQQLQKDGYVWDRRLSASSCAVVLKKGDDIWVLDLDGNISHNPDFLIFNV